MSEDTELVILDLEHSHSDLATSRNDENTLNSHGPTSNQSPQESSGVNEILDSAPAPIPTVFLFLYTNDIVNGTIVRCIISDQGNIPIWPFTLPDGRNVEGCIWNGKLIIAEDPNPGPNSGLSSFQAAELQDMVVCLQNQVMQLKQKLHQASVDWQKEKIALQLKSKGQPGSGIPIQQTANEELNGALKHQAVRRAGTLPSDISPSLIAHYNAAYGSLTSTLQLDSPSIRNKMNSNDNGNSSNINSTNPAPIPLDKNSLPLPLPSLTNPEIVPQQNKTKFESSTLSQPPSMIPELQKLAAELAPTPAGSILPHNTSSSSSTTDISPLTPPISISTVKLDVPDAQTKHHQEPENLGKHIQHQLFVRGLNSLSDRTFNQSNVLMAAIKRNDLEFEQALLSKGELLFDTNLNGETCLHIAARCNRPDIAERFLSQPEGLELIDHPTILYYRSSVGEQTALHIAVQHRTYEVAKVIIKYHGNPRIPNAANATALQMATKLNDEQMIHILNGDAT